MGNVFLASYSYAPNGGLLQSMSYGNGDSVEYAYDALARVSEVYYNENEDPALTYGYASNGALGSLTDHENERLYVYSYDGLDRLLSMTESYDGAAVQIFHADYDTANRVSSTGYRVSPTWNDDLGDPRAYEYTYSLTNGSLSGMTLPGGGAYSYTYDGLRRLNSRSLALNNSPFLTREYDYVPGTGANDTTTLVGTLTNKKGNGTTLDGWTYTYDDVGRITSISDGMETWSYTYDVQGQLLTEQKGSGEDYYSASYIYDTAGNIRSKTIEVPGEPEPEPTPTPTPDPTPTPTPDPGGGNGHGGEIIIGTDPLDPILPTPTPDAGLDSGEQGGNGVQTVTHTKLYTYSNAQWPDLLTAYDGHSISYDASGNPTIWYDGATMSWEHGRQLASVSATNDHAALSFSYDNSGLRLTKTVGTGANAVEHRYTWQGSKLIAEAFGDTELEFFYDESGSPYALLVRDSSTATPTVALFFYVTNLQGDVVMLLDASGNVVAEYSYNAWGEILSSAGTMADVNPIRYRGYYYDVETGLYYLQSRYYDPEIGRFINADAFASTGQGILGSNMFAYCGNEPVIRADLQGSISLNCLSVKDSGKREIIKYNVVNYSQEGPTCWAYCQTMIEFFYMGQKENKDAAKNRAEEICKEVYGDTDYLRSGWPTNLGDKTMVYSLEELFFVLSESGPMYAYYSSEEGAHMVVVIGVNLLTRTVHVNNPWGVDGYQTFEEFLDGFYVKEGQDNLGMSFRCLFYFNRED